MGPLCEAIHWFHTNSMVSPAFACAYALAAVAFLWQLILGVWKASGEMKPRSLLAAVHPTGVGSTATGLKPVFGVKPLKKTPLMRTPVK
jgi:hypothetical protein